MRRRSSWPIPCQAASSYADSAGPARCRCSAIPRARWTPEPPVATEFPFATESPADAGAALSVVLASRAGPAAPADPLFSQHVVQAASSYAHSAGQELLSMLRPHADAASTSWEAREDLGQGSNFESFLPVRSRLAPAHRWLVAIGQERVQERLCKGPESTSIANACARGSKVGGDNMYRNKGVYFRKKQILGGKSANLSQIGVSHRTQWRGLPQHLVGMVRPAQPAVDWLHPRKPTAPSRHILFTFDQVAPQLSPKVVVTA